MSQQTAILDIGSFKIICLICSPDGKDGIVVNGAGIREYKGYKNGWMLDETQFKDAVVDALTTAETEAKHSVRDITVGVPASFLKIVLHTGETQPRARSGRVSIEDVDDVITASLDFPEPEGFELIHSTPVEFYIDGVSRREMPLNMPAKTLGATVSHVYVDTRFKGIVSAALGRLKLDADVYIGVPLCEGIFVIPEEERAGRAVLVDVGGLTTDISLMYGSALVDMRTIPVGGCHFTSDLSFGLGINAQTAENVKRRYVYSLDYQDSIDTIRVHGGGVMRVDHATIQYIIEERTSELVSLIAGALREMGVDSLENVPVYLSGGGVTLMRGSCEFMEKRLGAPISVRMPWMPRLSSPNYASAFSVMDFVRHSDDEDNAGRLSGSSGRGGLIEKIKDFFTK